MAPNLGKILVAALSLASICTSAAFAEIGINEKEIVIGNPNAQSGDNAFSGKETTIGINTYINSVNAQGGINGRKIRVITCDDKYEIPGAFACFDQLQKEHVFAITGLVGSALLAKYIPLCSNNKMPAVGFYSGPSFVSTPAKRYIFTVRGGYRDEEKQFVDHMWNDVGVRKIAIIYQNDSYGADHLEGLKEALAAHGAQMVAAASYERNTVNMQDAFDTVRKAAPEAVVLAANHHQCAKVIKMAHAGNWRPIFWINSGANVDGFLPEVGKDGDGVLVSETVPSAYRMDLPLIKQYQKALKQYYPNESPCFTSLRGYIDAMVLLEGLKRAGKNPTREAFVDALDGIKNWDIGLGKGMEVSYTPGDHFGMHKYAFGTVKNGDVVPVANWKSLKK